MSMCKSAFQLSLVVSAVTLAGWECCAGLFQKVLQWQGVEIDLDEVECIVANLIYRKYLKGYISHSHRVVVVSKQDPFPKLSSINLPQD